MQEAGQTRRGAYLASGTLLKNEQVLTLEQTKTSPVVIKQ